MDDVEPVAARLGTSIIAITREGLSARLAGLARALREPHLPFFVARDPGVADPGAGGSAGGIDWVELSGDARRLGEWLGGEELPLRVSPGPPAVVAIGIGGQEAGWPPNSRPLTGRAGS